MLSDYYDEVSDILWEMPLDDLKARVESVCEQVLLEHFGEDIAKAEPEFSGSYEALLDKVQQDVASGRLGQETEQEKQVDAKNSHRTNLIFLWQMSKRRKLDENFPIIERVSVLFDEMLEAGYPDEEIRGVLRRFVDTQTQA